MLSWLKASLLFALLLMVSACLQEGGGEGSEESTPPDSAPNPIIGDPITENGLLPPSLIDFILQSEESPDCISQSIVLKKADASTQTYNSIQEAINASSEGDEVIVGQGTYPGILTIKQKKNLFLSSQCKALIQGSIEISKSDNVTIEGFRISPEGLSRNAINLKGGSSKSSNVTIQLNEIFRTNRNYQGIHIGKNNEEILVRRNYIHHNGRNGLRFRDGTTGFNIAEENLITENRWNGVKTGDKHKVELRDNMIIANGRDSSSHGGNYGVFREGDKKGKTKENLNLLRNIITYNFGKVKKDSSIDLGKFDQILDSLDVGNVTTNGTEGTGVQEIVDDRAPELRVALIDGRTVDKAILPLRVLAMDRSPVQIRVSVNGQEASFVDEFVFVTNLTLIERDNIIRIEAEDRFGNKSSLERRVFFQTEEGEEVPVVRCNDGEIYALDQASNETTYSTIQAAVDAVSENSIIFVGPGVYNEIVEFDEHQNITLKTHCLAQIKGVELKKSRFISIDGFIIDADNKSKNAILLKGSGGGNQNISILNNEIRNSKNKAGISVSDKAPETRIFNNFIHKHGKQGIELKDKDSGPTFIEKNTISDNGHSGVKVGKKRVVRLIDNIIVNNGLDKLVSDDDDSSSDDDSSDDDSSDDNSSDDGSSDDGGGSDHYGLFVKKQSNFDPTTITLSGNTIVNNNGKIVAGKSSRDIGNYNLLFDATDGVNKTTDGSEDVEKTIPLNDVDMPEVTLGVADGFLTNNPILVLPISVNEMSPTKTQVFLNGTLVDESMLFEFLSVLALEEEDNTIEVRATDSVGNVTSEVIIVDLDTIPPVLGNFFPTPNEIFYTNTLAVLVSGEANEPIQSVEVNGTPLTIFADQQVFSGLFAGLFEGAVTLNFRAVDLAGNVAEQSISFDLVFDTVLPVVTLTGDQDIFTNVSDYSFAVDTDEANPFTVSVLQNGQEIQTSDQANFVVNATLVEGLNSFEVIATDAAGNMSDVASLNGVVLDTIPPVVSVDEPSSGELIQLFNFPVSGSANEIISSMKVAGQNVAVNGSAFSGSIDAPVEGNVDLFFEATDRAGNVGTATVPVQISLRLLNIDLVMAEPSPNPGKLNVVGGAGAARPGATVEVKRGLFGSDSTVALENGAFLIETDLFSDVFIEASKDGESEEGRLTFNIDTKLSGIIRDNSDLPLPNVTVRILGTGISTLTNGSGVFAFDDPPTGLQTLEMDATTVPPEVVGMMRRFSKFRVKVNVGVAQQNVIERPIYFPAMLLDGTQTTIVNGSGATVTSPHAPGVSLQIPAGTVTFPDGSNSGDINLGIIDSERSTLPVLAAAVPDEVICLEPSGLQFSEPVQITIPNDNELPEGTDFAIFSLNSSSGQWEVDGVATVDSGGATMTTKPGQGITHFSEIYAVPILPELRELGEVARPGIDAFGGSLTREIALPSFKSLGQDIAPRLMYRSAWANPTATINHFIDVPPQEMTFERSAQGNGLDVCYAAGLDCAENYDDYWKFVKFADFQQSFQTAYQPESIAGKLFIGDVQANVTAPNTDPSIPFESVPTDVDIEKLQGLPNQSVMSYAVELKDNSTGEYLQTGVYPTLGRYEIELKKLTITSVNFIADFDRKFSGLGGLVKKRVKRRDILAGDPPTVETEILEDALLHDVPGELVVKNEVASPAGRGWTVGGTQKVVNPTSNRLLIDEGNGNTSFYNVDNRISTVWANPTSRSIGTGVDLSQAPKAFVARPESPESRSSVIEIDLETGSTQTRATVSGNQGSFYNTSHIICGSFPTRVEQGEFFRVQRYRGITRVDLTGVVGTSSGIFSVDRFNHRYFKSSGTSLQHLSGAFKSPRDIGSFGTGSFFLSASQAQNLCRGEYGSNCSLQRDTGTQNCYQIRDVVDNRFGRIFEWTQLHNDLFSEQLFREPINDPNRNHFLNVLNIPPPTVANINRSFAFGRNLGGNELPTPPDSVLASNVFRTGINKGSLGKADSNGLNSPSDIVVDNNGDFLVVDRGNNKIRRFDAASNARSTVAGNGSTNGQGDGGPATQASIVLPNSVVVDSDGSMFISTGNNKIRKVDPSGIISTYAGLASGVDEANMEIHVSQLAFSNPTGMAIDKDRRFLYVADTGNHRIVRIDLDSNRAISVAGNRTCVAAPGDGGAALNASLCSPTRLGLDEDGNLYIWDQGHQSVRRVIFSNTGGAIFLSANQDNSTITKNSDGTFTRNFRDGSTIEFDENGIQLSISDRVGRETTFEYDSEDRLTKITDPVGQEITYTYSGDKLISITDPAGRTTSFNYIGDFLERVNFPDGTNRRYFYDSKGLIVEERDQRDNKTEYEYTEFNRLAKTTRADGSEIAGEDLESKATGNNATEENPAQLASLGKGDDDLFDGIKDPRNIETRFERDIFGYVTTFEDGEGREFEIQRDELGKPLKITRPDDSTVDFTYDTNTQDLLRREDSSGLTIENEYNQFGQTTRQIGDDQIEVLTAYNAEGLVTSNTVEGQVKFNNTYNALGLVNQRTVFTGSGSIVVDFTYDSKGQITTRTVSSGEETVFEYDLAGNVTKKTERVAIGTDKVTNFTYDLFNRLKTVTLPDSTVTTYTYLDTGELQEVKDHLDNKITFVYDQLGQLKEKIDQNGKVTKRFYDANGNVSRTEDAKGNIVEFEYDNLDRVSQKTLPDDVLNFAYDVRGNVETVSNINSSITNIYDNRDRLTSTTTSGSGALSGYPTTTINFNYDIAGNLDSQNDSLGGSVDYGYDNQNRLTSLTNHKSETFGFTYDDNDRLIRQTRPGSETLFTLNDSSFIMSIAHKAGSVTKASYVYQRNDLGFATQMDTRFGANVYGYDNNSQLTSATHPVSSHDTLTAESFNYDAIGNRIVDQTGNYTYNLTSQLLNEDPRNFYLYDDNGNMTQKQSKATGHITKFDYTSENQLKKLTVLQSMTGPILKEVTYAYDALGRRMQKAVIDNQNLADPAKTFTRRYVYDGNEIMAELNGSNDLLVRYTHSRLRTDDVLAVDVTADGVTAKIATAAGSYFYLKDALGTVTDVMNASGDLLQSYNYSAFGTLVSVRDVAGVDISSAPVLSTAYTFTGREFDGDTGLYYYRARYYDPSTGRFLQRDPNPGKLVLPISIFNSYIYAGNNPLGFVDPQGEFFFTAVFIGAALGATIGTVDAVINGGDIIDGFLGGLAIGAVLGAAFGAGVDIGIAFAEAGFAATGTGAVTTEAVIGRTILSTVVGSAAGALIGGVGFEAFDIGSFEEGALLGGILGGIGGATGALTEFLLPSPQQTLDRFFQGIRSGRIKFRIRQGLIPELGV